MFEPKKGQFALFKNDKGENEARPDYTGDGLDTEGRPIRVAAWIKQGKNGKFMACKIQLKDSQKVREEPVRTETKSSGRSGFDDLEQLPF